MTIENSTFRLDAFSDGVFAIAITLLVLDIKLPSSMTVESNADFWLALGRIAPAMVAFVLSFGVILITWVNHHGFTKSVDKTSASFIFANGFLLMTIVVLPFPTSLLGEYVLTDHASPAVVLYNAIASAQGLAWVLLSTAALKNHLTKNETSAVQMHNNRRSGYVAFIVYGLLAIVALWIPLTSVIITSMSWIFWLIFGMKLKQE